MRITRHFIRKLVLICISGVLVRSIVVLLNTAAKGVTPHHNATKNASMSDTTATATVRVKPTNTLSTAWPKIVVTNRKVQKQDASVAKRRKLINMPLASIVVHTVPEYVRDTDAQCSHERAFQSGISSLHPNMSQRRADPLHSLNMTHSSLSNPPRANMSPLSDPPLTDMSRPPMDPPRVKMSLPEARKKYPHSSALVSAQPFCDCTPTDPTAAGSVERFDVNLDCLLNLTWEDVNSGLKNLDPGGHWRPSHCAPLRRVAVIIPYRDRGSHLRAFLAHTHPILQKQAVEYQIFVIEQNVPFVFNKGSLMNVGYREVVERSGFRPDCLVYHDVDLLLETPGNLFMCRQAPVHFAVYINKFNYTLPYDAMFGGGVALTPEQFKKVNGYSNKFAGWGGEDDDFYRRVAHVYKKIYRPPMNMSRYTMIKHRHDAGNPINKQAFKGFRSKARSFTEGLLTLKYERISLDLLPTYTRILVNFPDKLPTGTQYDTVSSRRCLDTVYRTVAVSRPTCQNLCNHDDHCRVFQHEAPSGADERCLMFQHPCSNITEDSSTDIYTRHNSQLLDILLL